MKSVEATVTFKYDFSEMIQNMNEERKTNGEPEMTDDEIRNVVTEDLHTFDFRETVGGLPVEITISEGTDRGSLVGRWFHSLSDNGEIERQGVVVNELSEDRYVIQLFEWVSGSPSVQKVVEFGTLRKWNFYPSAREMRREYSRIKGRAFDEDEQFLQDIQGVYPEASS